MYIEEKKRERETQRLDFWLGTQKPRLVEILLEYKCDVPGIFINILKNFLNTYVVNSPNASRAQTQFECKYQEEAKKLQNQYVKL